MKKIISFILITILSILSISCSKNKEITNETDKYYEYVNTPYGKHSRQILDLYIPKNETKGLILFIHGGSWIAGNKDGYNGDLKFWCETMGYAASAINYRYIGVGVNYKDILDDITSALTKIKELSEEKNVFLSKVLLTGHSAGGHLSLLYSYSRIDEAPITPTCVVSEAGPSDFTDENWYIDNELSIQLVYLFSNLTGVTITAQNYTKKTDSLLAASPIHYINEKTVPTVICHGVKDDVVPYSNAERLHQKLDEYNVENYLIPYPNSDHGLSNDQEVDSYANQLMQVFANKYLK